VICFWLYIARLSFVWSIKLVNKKKITKTMCDSLNHTRFLKEDHLPDWVCWDKHSNKGDRVEDEGTTIVQNIKNYLLIDIASYPRRLESSATPRWEQILIWKISVGNYALYAVPHRSNRSLQQHYCQNLKSTHGRLSLWLVSMYSLRNPEQNYENLLKVCHPCCVRSIIQCI